MLPSLATLKSRPKTVQSRTAAVDSSAKSEDAKTDAKTDAKGKLYYTFVEDVVFVGDDDANASFAESLIDSGYFRIGKYMVKVFGKYVRSGQSSSELKEALWKEIVERVTKSMGRKR
jgi:hypothetical protein